MDEKIRANRKYKDSVFRMLFRSKAALLGLYNALNRTDYQDPELLTVTTLENAIYMNMKNDISFLLDVTLKLSDAFETGPGHEKEEEPSLELKVRFLNINLGHNRELMERCRTLREYSEFVARIRRYANRGAAIEEAVERAVTECIEEGILSDFLRSQRAEVIAVSIFEYNEEEELKKLRRAEFQSGMEEGIAQGIEQGLVQGKAEAKAESVLLALEMKGSVPERLRRRICSETDSALLENWLRLAIEAGTIEIFMQKTGLSGEDS